jgi:monoamine oxidase
MEGRLCASPVLPEPAPPQLNMSAADRRTERRHRGQGPLKLLFDDPSRQEVVGRLVDYSNSGFRAVHPYTALHTGQEVEFRHSIAVGKARVMWNRIADDHVETGFLVIK